MRLLLIVIILCLTSAPAFGKSEPLRRECHRLTSQIARYEGDVKLARERGNELWEDATLQQIERLSDRRARRCPQYAKDNGESLRRFYEMLGKAAALAAKYFTMGGF
jgi:hypothetical protein